MLSNIYLYVFFSFLLFDIFLSAIKVIYVTKMFMFLVSTEVRYIANYDVM